MTSSPTSTDARSRRTTRLAGLGAAAVSAFLLVATYRYHFRPTPAMLFLVAGWVSLLVAGWLLVRAARAFDLTRVTPEAVDAGAVRRADLQREKRDLLKAIKEVEFDVAMGKVDDADAGHVMGRYRARALEIMKSLEEVEVVAAPDPKYAAIVEKELQKRVRKAGACTCGARNDDDATFCKKCGTKLAASGDA